MAFFLIQKIFEIVLGALMIVLLFNIFSSVTQSSCFPSELYSHEELTGFKTGIFDNVYDNFCNTFISMNSGVWQMYKTWVGQTFASNILNGVSNTIWNGAKYFCKTHTNFDYAKTGSDDAITDPQVLLEIILYESERCWNIFEGRNLNGTSLASRDPIPDLGYFPCAEIIYDFPKGAYLNMSRIFERAEGKNTCGEALNMPKVFSSSKDSVFWCMPNDLAQDFWYDRFKDVKTYDSGECTDVGYEFASISSSNCLSSKMALCSLGESYAYSSDSNSLAVIEGAGKITVSYFDYYDWQTYNPSFNRQEYLKNEACKGSKFNDISYPRDSLAFCYERYDAPSYECSGTIDCSKFGTTNWGNWLTQTECEYALGCEEALFGGCLNRGNSECSDYSTKAECLSNDCNFGAKGRCEGELLCSGCSFDLAGTSSPCDRSYACRENWGNLFSGYCESAVNSCEEITSEYYCSKASCAGCFWTED
jgi:hypothetical protein